MSNERPLGMWSSVPLGIMTPETLLMMKECIQMQRRLLYKEIDDRAKTLLLRLSEDTTSFEEKAKARTSLIRQCSEFRDYVETMDLLDQHIERRRPDGHHRRWWRILDHRTTE